MADETIAPALTAEEWARGFARDDLGNSIHAMDGDIAIVFPGYTYHVSNLPALIALANAALPDGHPLKTTRAEVEAAHAIATNSGAWTDENRDTVERLASILAALLPPEGA